MLGKLAEFSRDLSDASKLLSAEKKQKRKLLFYSESAGYFRYFEGIYEYLLQQSQLDFSYISSQADDPVFSKEDRVDKYFIKNSLAATFARLDSDLVLLTVPDLGNSYLKRPAGNTRFFYIFHALVSTHLQYKSRAFDNYDCILTAGPHHDAEIRETEKVYGLKTKALFQSGYFLSEKLFLQSQERSLSGANKDRKRVLIAPSWSKGGIFESCLDELIEAFLALDFEIVLRPHPEFLKRYPEQVKNLMGKCKGKQRLLLETNHLSGSSILDSDLLVTDRSGICFEFAFAREKPVLFIDTPLKVENPQYEKISMTPLEISTRKLLGPSLTPGQIKAGLPDALKQLEMRADEFRQEIVGLRAQVQYNWLCSAEKTSKFILESLA